ncbi:MAG: hypothetical protein AAF965_15335, partial [Pseudomonadota bacterium]
SDGRDYVPVGGPEVLTQNALAEAAFEALGKPPKITHLPDTLRRIALKLMPYVTPPTVHGPAAFFLTALGMNMVGKTYGTKHVSEHFADLVRSQENDADTQPRTHLRARHVS